MTAPVMTEAPGESVTGSTSITAAPGDWIVLRYGCTGTGWTITPVNSSPALADLYPGPIWMCHGDTLMFTASGPDINAAWTTQLDAIDREAARLRARLSASEAALEASAAEVAQLKEALVKLALRT